MIKKIKNIFKKKKKLTYNINRKRNFKTIELMFNSIKKENDFVDHSTWADLNMNKVYSNIDRTLTTPGEQKLYSILREPLYDKEKLEKRGEVISIFDRYNDFRRDVHEELNRIERTDDDIIYILKEGLETNFIMKIIYNLFTIFSVLSIVSIFLIPNFRSNAILILGVISSLNMFLHYSAGRKIGDKIETIEYTGNMIKVSGSLLNVLENRLPNYCEKINRLYKTTRKIGKKSKMITTVEGLDVFADYINILFLVKERNYFSIVDQVEKYNKEIIELYNLIGEIDAYVSISLYRDNLEYYTIPKFTYEKRVMKSKDVIHPLLEDPIPNDVNFEKGGMVLTGSNMSGKSTFLRIIGVNVILSQTIYTVLAKEYISSFYRVVSSISLQDNIGEGKSYYFAEAEAILRMINSTESEVTTLALIDEIFKGTNPVERINAAAEILNYIDKQNAFTVVATHDLNLIPLIHNYIRYYFMENMTDEGMEFDYKLRKGISPTRNAVKILKFIGYPKDLLENIDKRLEKIE
ncbi:MutS-related protein [Senegalia massiliensis]|uniref:DNA mismatch repair protein MutS n=1 Tax=Senegalia massiliensis TaxID=1720316 RepID=A0A845QU05_9CLOT|nr:DNA mismatch repair protein MutS [Senegalia massiliensis]NBI05514.1 DNA mismatch repair protein MutS [Senegalia massiliensis]